MATYSFVKIMSDAALDDALRCLVDEGDQPGQTLIGWLKIEVDDQGEQIADDDYYIPLYILGAEDIDTIPDGFDDADSNGRATWGKFKGTISDGFDDGDSR